MVSSEVTKEFEHKQTMEEKQDLIQELRNELKKERPERDNYFTKENLLIWRVTKPEDTLFIYSYCEVAKIKNLSVLTTKEINDLINILEA